ncbi:MAG: ATP-binding protein [Pseudomonadota bacterium]
MPPGALKFPKVSRQEFLVTVVLGLMGFLLNTFELQLGWGVHFIFGGALIYAFARLLSPQMLVLGIAISSLWTIFLWHHPWAWIVWVCEAVFIAFVARNSSAVRRDLIFWLMLGTPLLLLTYGAVMKMDALSLWLVVAKQSANGILNIVLGELLYLTLMAGNPFRKFGHWPKMKMESVVITWLMAIILIPTAVYLALDAPAREQAARKEVGTNLGYRLAVSNAAVSNWVHSRGQVLRMHAADELNEEGVPDPDFFQEISSDFEEVTIIGQGQRLIWSAQSARRMVQMPELKPSPNAISGQRGMRLVDMAPQRAGEAPQFKLIVPFYADGEAGIIEAKLRAGILYDIANGQRQSGGYGIFLASPVQGATPLSSAPAAWGKEVEGLSPAKRMEALAAPLLLSDVGYGSAVMADLRNALIMRSTSVADLPEWQLIGIAPLAPAVIAARQIQLKQLSALMAFCVVIAILAHVLSRRMTHTLRMLSQSAADLTATGTTSGPFDGMVVQELSEVLGHIKTAGKTVGRERGTLANYRRRLNGIVQHAPVIVYALNVSDGGKGELVYVSESLEKILGYTSADISEPEWWSRAVHPDDNMSNIGAFGNLSPDQAVSVEYRMQHKKGHYVWVYDSLSVEINSHTGQLEAVGVIMDISERKAAAEQLLQADKMASLGRMISGTAHELNQPLNFIKMAASNLRQNVVRGRLDAEQLLPKLENIMGQVERASAILLQMRIFGRTPKESPYPIDVKSAVEAVVAMVAPQFEFDGTQVEVLEKSGPVHVHALPMLLEQVLLNLLLNANDAIRARFRPKESEKGRIQITVERRQQLAVVTVEDNGTGISADVLRQIFDPFFTTKPPKEGTGLGLSISYGIIRDLGGVIRAKSGRNGARFTIELPLAEDKAVVSKADVM